MFISSWSNDHDYPLNPSQLWWLSLPAWVMILHASPQFLIILGPKFHVSPVFPSAVAARISQAHCTALCWLSINFESHLQFTFSIGKNQPLSIMTFSLPSVLRIPRSPRIRMSSRSRLLKRFSMLRPRESKHDYLYYHLDLHKALTSYFYRQQLGNMPHQTYQTSLATSKSKNITHLIYVPLYGDSIYIGSRHLIFPGESCSKSRLRTSVNTTWTCQVLE